MYVKLFRSILNSTVWMEEDHVVRVWITMLLLADANGIVKVSVPGLAKESRVSIEDCRSALGTLESPDPDSQSKEEEGRRILRIDESEPIWFIVNYDFYRSLRNTESRKEYMKNYMREYRERQKNTATIECKPSVNTCKPPLAQGEGEGDGKGEETYPPSDDDETFKSWWSRYPKKVKRKDAERAFNKLTKSAKVAASGPGYDAWLHKWEVDGTEKKYIPNPATWINAEQWQDEDVKPERRQRKSGDVDMYVGAGDDYCPYPDPTK